MLIAPAAAQLVVKDAWVRATVPQQKATGAFMQLTAAQDSKLVSVSSAAVPVVEVHEMKMQDGVMKMRPLPSLSLPAGKAVSLTPGGYHVMLMDLKQQLKPGDPRAADAGDREPGRQAGDRGSHGGSPRAWCCRAKGGTSTLTTSIDAGWPGSTGHIDWLADIGSGGLRQQVRRVATGRQRARALP